MTGFERPPVSAHTESSDLNRGHDEETNSGHCRHRGQVEGLGHRQHEEVPEESEHSGNQVSRTVVAGRCGATGPATDPATTGVTVTLRERCAGRLRMPG